MAEINQKIIEDCTEMIKSTRPIKEGGELSEFDANRLMKLQMDIINNHGTESFFLHMKLAGAIWEKDDIQKELYEDMIKEI